MTLSNFVAYVTQKWKNKPDTSTPLSAERLTHQEDGIKANSDAIQELAAAVVSQIVNNPDKIASMAALYAVDQKVAGLDGKIGDTSKLPAGTMDAVGAIAQLYSNLTRLSEIKVSSASYDIPQKTQQTFTPLKLSAGTWLIIGHCISNLEDTGAYNFTVNGRIVRGDNKNGGGCINSMLIVLHEETFISLGLYQNASTTLKMKVYLQAIRIG